VSVGTDKWWDGYDGEKGVLIDDYAGAWPISYLLKVLHEHPQKAQYKGGMVELQAKYIVITSNLHPDMWYPNADLPHKEALKRRISRLVWMDKPWSPVKDEPMDDGDAHQPREINDLTLSDDE